MDKVRVAFLGGGQIAQLHALGYGDDNAHGRLVAVADIDAAVARARAAAWGLERWTTDYRELLADPGIDAVEILLPHHLHMEAALEALAAGKHVSLQKPMAICLAEADRICAAAATSGRVFRVFENFRAYEPYRRAKALVDAGQIGQPLSIRVKTIAGRGVGGWTQPEPAKAWRRDPRTGGGPPAIIDHGYHLTSIVLFFMGPVERVYAMADPGDAAAAQIVWRHTCGAYGSWEIVTAPELRIRTRYYPEDEWLEVTGSRGIVWVTHCSGDLLGEAPVILYRDGETRRFHDMQTGWETSFVCGAHEFCRAVVDGTQPEMEAGQARHALAFSLAAMRSARERREVALAQFG